VKQLIIVLVNAYTDNCADRDTARFLCMYVIIFIIKYNHYIAAIHHRTINQILKFS
jgi:hypothetical protein